MKKLFLFLLIAGIGCSGGGTTEEHIPSKIIHVKFTNLPQGLDLNAENVSVRGTLSLLDSEGKTGDLLAGPAASSRLTNGSHAIDFGSVLEGKYQLAVEIAQGTGSPDASSLRLASAAPTISIGEEPITEVTIDGSTLEFNFDEDGDFLNNLQEIGFGTSPHHEDTDGDGVNDRQDVFPLNPEEITDIDGDGIGDNSDPDMDNDGLENEAERVLGTNPQWTDTDHDGRYDGDDNCPLRENPMQTDNDQDGVGDLCDEDDDNDGLLDRQEIERGSDPRLADTDGDGTLDSEDAFPRDAVETVDFDNDGIGNNADLDDDGDGLSDAEELVRWTNPLDTDSDDDGIPDNIDTCPLLATGNNVDTDGDGVGDECDPDDDNDTIPDLNEGGFAQAYTDPKRADTDGDSILDQADNCPNAPNTAQRDSDSDGWGNACDCNPNDNNYYPFAPDEPEVITNNPDTPDFNETDQNCDSMDGNRYRGIFVDREFGNDGNGGTLDSPVASLNRAVDLAQARAFSDIFVARGIYRLDEGTNDVIFPDGLRLFGGYADNFQARDVRNIDSELRSESAGPTLYLFGRAGLVVDGFLITKETSAFYAVTVLIEESEATLSHNRIRGNAVEGFESTAVYVVGSPTATILGNDIDGGLGTTVRGIYIDNSAPRVINNIVGGDGRHTTCVEIYESDPVLANNTLVAGSDAARADISEGVVLIGSSPRLVNNVILTPAGRTQTAVSIFNENPSRGMWIHNYIQTFPSRGVAPLLIDAQDNFYFTIEDFNAFGSRLEEVQIENNLNVPWLTFAEILNGSGGPVPGSPLIDAGINASGESYGSVTDDFGGRIRNPFGYDIGALEL